MNTPTERERFEAWADAARKSLSRADCWDAWQARAALAPPQTPPVGKFSLGERVTKTKGSRWTGQIVGTYSTMLTPEGYAVESETEAGSVQIYPAAALEAAHHPRAAELSDAARLDYIASNARCDPKMDGQHVWWPTSFNHRLTGATLRDAIDAAMEQKR